MDFFQEDLGRFLFGRVMKLSQERLERVFKNMHDSAHETMKPETS